MRMNHPQLFCTREQKPCRRQNRCGTRGTDRDESVKGLGADAISFLAYLLQTIAMIISDGHAPILRNDLHISLHAESARIYLKTI